MCDGMQDSSEHKMNLV